MDILYNHMGSRRANWIDAKKRSSQSNEVRRRLVSNIGISRNSWSDAARSKCFTAVSNMFGILWTCSDHNLFRQTNAGKILDKHQRKKQRSVKI